MILSLVGAVSAQDWTLLEAGEGAIQARYEAEYVGMGGKSYLVVGTGVGQTFFREGEEGVGLRRDMFSH